MTFEVGCTYLDNEGVEWTVVDRVNHVLLIAMSGVPDVSRLAIDEDGEQATIRSRTSRGKMILVADCNKSENEWRKKQ